LDVIFPFLDHFANIRKQSFCLWMDPFFYRISDWQWRAVAVVPRVLQRV
jgi:hypothetical protein